MLPASHRQRYQAFQQSLETLRQTISQSVYDPPIVKATVRQLQELFQSQLLSLDLEDVPPALAHQVQSYQVEIDKQLRLLNLDMMFLQSARQTETAKQRQQQASDRLSTLIRYCTVLLSEEPE